MTLTEYMNQTEPKRNNFVELDPKEYMYYTTIPVNSMVKDRTILITDPTFVKMFGYVEYYKKGLSNLLYTTDGDGNPLRVSTFSIKYHGTAETATLKAHTKVLIYKIT